LPPTPDKPSAQVGQVRLGKSGLHVSRLALGMMSFGDTSRRAWVLDEHAAEPIVRRAIEHGISVFDTADVYAGGASEIVTGKLLRKLIARDEAVVATKVFYPTTAGASGGGLSRKHILAAIDASLARLRMDYVDLYQIHRHDPETPIEETMEALHDVVRAGKARYLGASTMPAWRLAQAQAVAERHGWTRFVSMQNHYNLLYREEEREMIPLCLEAGVGVIPYSPLARGLLAGSRGRGGGDRRTTRAGSDPVQDELYGQPGDAEVIDRVAAVAAERGVPPAQLALAWLLHKPAVTTPIVGVTRPEHLDDAVAATTLALSAEEIALVEEPYIPHRVDEEPAPPAAGSSS
jgi:1-deoxyxylulose-5-phosphate synthase